MRACGTDDVEGVSRRTQTSQASEPFVSSGRPFLAADGAGSLSAMSEPGGEHLSGSDVAASTRTVVAARDAELGRVFAEAFDIDAPVALIDYPNHNNCGDNAIWLGERTVLDRLGVRVASISDQACYDVDEIRAAGVGTILIHGGGNFGSIWPQEQAFRERVVRDHPDLPIVQLPQTLHFETESSIDAARRAFSDHRRFRVLARDDRSLAIARDRLGLDAVGAPDAAFGLGSLPTTRQPQVPVVWMSRTDGEGTIAAPTAEVDVRVVDWLRGNPFDRRAQRRASVTVRLRRLYIASQRSSAARRAGRPFRARSFDALARRRLDRGLDILSYGEVVVTDRLHGHILCSLLGKRHVVLDTRHGKVSGFLEAHPPPAGLVSVARSTGEALDLARSMIGPSERTVP